MSEDDSGITRSRLAPEPKPADGGLTPYQLEQSKQLINKIKVPKTREDKQSEAPEEVTLQPVPKEEESIPVEQMPVAVPTVPQEKPKAA